MIWVIGEYRDGALLPAAREAAGAGVILSEGLQTGMNLLVLGGEAGDGSPVVPVSVLKNVQKIYFLGHKLLSYYTNDGYLKALDFLKDKEISAIVVPGTAAGKDLGPCLAVSLGLACVSRVNGLRVVDKKICASRPLYGGKIIEEVVLKKSPVVITMPRAFKEPPYNENKAGGELIREHVTIAGGDIRVRVKEVSTQKAGKADITEADVLISGGRGVGGPDGFKLLKELADAMGGVTAASRAAVDSKWMPHSIQVGQTGKTVSPKLYIAVGISGAPQHLAGMRTSRYVLAINKDPGAPIFKESDLGINADLFEAIPELLKEIKALKGR